MPPCLIYNLFLSPQLNLCFHSTSTDLQALPEGFPGSGHVKKSRHLADIPNTSILALPLLPLGKNLTKFMRSSPKSRKFSTTSRGPRHWATCSKYLGPGLPLLFCTLVGTLFYFYGPWFPCVWNASSLPTNKGNDPTHTSESQQSALKGGPRADITKLPVYYRGSLVPGAQG